MKPIEATLVGFATGREMAKCAVMAARNSGEPERVRRAIEIARHQRNHERAIRRSVRNTP